MCGFSLVLVLIYGELRGTEELLGAEVGEYSVVVFNINIVGD